MASVDRTAIKSFKRLSQTLIQSVKDNTIAPKTLPQSSTDTYFITEVGSGGMRKKLC